MTVTIRDIYGEIHDADVTQPASGRDPLIVKVPMIGYVIAILEPPSTEPIMALAGPRLRVAAAPLTPSDNPKLRRLKGVKVDGGWEVELLPNEEDEDRIVLCIPDDALEAP